MRKLVKAYMHKDRAVLTANTKVNVQNQELRFDGGKITEVSTMEDDNAWFYVI